MNSADCDFKSPIIIILSRWRNNTAMAPIRRRLLPHRVAECNGTRKYLDYIGEPSIKNKQETPVRNTEHEAEKYISTQEDTLPRRSEARPACAHLGGYGFNWLLQCHLKCFFSRFCAGIGCQQLPDRRAREYPLYYRLTSDTGSMAC